MRRIIIALVCVIALTLPAAALSAEVAESAAPAGPLKVGDMIPADFKAMDLDGNEVTLRSALADNFTVFQFMTTACSACQGELEQLVRLMKTRAKGQFEVVAVAMDILGADAVNAYEKRYSYGVKYLLDSEFTLPPRFGFKYTPSLFIADSSGKIVLAKGGYDPSKVKEEMKEILEITK